MRAQRYSDVFAWIAVAIVLLVVGCAPVISQRALEEVDRSVSFEQLLDNPDAYRGKTVLLGGTIIETQNFSDRTLITILQRPLGYRDRPTSEDVSMGRFILQVPGFLDPAIYRPGRKVTVVGSVMGREVRPLGEVEYSYPLIEKRALHLWPAEHPGTVPRVHFGVAVGSGF